MPGEQQIAGISGGLNQLSRELERVMVVPIAPREQRPRKGYSELPMAVAPRFQAMN